MSLIRGYRGIHTFTIEGFPERMDFPESNIKFPVIRDTFIAYPLYFS
jgi:hypothetical protein